MELVIFKLLRLFLLRYHKLKTELSEEQNLIED
jgi:hypothetical protein